MLWHPSRALFCLLVGLLLCFLLLNMHLLACLIFSSDFVLCLMIVCRQIAHIYVFACCRIFGDATSSCVAVFAVGCSFFLRPRLLHCGIYACCNLFCSIYCNFQSFFYKVCPLVFSAISCTGLHNLLLFVSLFYVYHLSIMYQIIYSRSF